MPFSPERRGKKRVTDPRRGNPHSVHSSASARMTKIFEAEGGAEAQPGLLLPTKLTLGEGMQPGCTTKILEDKRWLKSADLHEAAILQRQQEQGNASTPHLGARKVEGRNA
jgi:hypothetical protein